MNWWREIIQLCKDCLFPIYCFECKTEGVWWCQSCINKNKTIGVFYCPVCHLPNINGQPCIQCKAASSINGVAAFLDYNDKNPIGELIRQFKYGFAYDIVSVWSVLVDSSLNSVIKKMDIDSSAICIIPVPLYVRRERERGFNQANLIAELVYKKISTFRQVDFDNKNLIRSKPTNQQAKLSRQERMVNLNGAFEWSGIKPAPKNVLLIDDVYTSGATTQECAKILKKFGAQKVYVFTLARD